MELAGARFRRRSLTRIVRCLMTSFTPILISLYLLLSSGCETPRQAQTGRGSDWPSGDFKKELAELSSGKIPTPTTTPYDNDPTAKEAYLAYFSKGYREGMNFFLNGISRTLCFHPKA